MPISHIYRNFEKSKILPLFAAIRKAHDINNSYRVILLIFKLPVKRVNTICSENSSLFTVDLTVFFSHAEIPSI